MWLKLLLLTLYLFLLFILSRILEVTSWYQGTGTFLSSLSTIDPFTLSVGKLKQLLDTRGISYSGVVEKQELLELVEASGKPSEEELSDEPIQTEASTNFTCGPHFYEEVEDTKDSVWLVQVITQDDGVSKPFWEKTWNEVIAKVSKFGIRTGVFHCSLDKGLCSRKRWTSSRLILALPRSNIAKEDVILHNYVQQHSSTDAILHWVRKHLASRVKTINSAAELKSQWTTYSTNSKHSEIRVVLFSILKSSPMFLSSLAIKFTGRVKFGMVQTSNPEFRDHVKSKNSPVYLVVMPENKFHYGSRRGELYNFKSLQIFLKSFIPEMNDVFLLSVLVANVLASFQLFFISGQIWRNLLKFVLCVVKYNCILFMMWMFILGLCQFRFMSTCADILLKFLRYCSGTNMASVLRNDCKSLWSTQFLIATFVIYSSITAFILKRMGIIIDDDDLPSISNWFLPQRDNRFTTHFFRPVSTRPMPAVPPDLEEGMELFIERLATPNLWLQPVISLDYINNLPMWKYQGWCETDDVLAGKKFENSSDDDCANIPFNPSNETAATQQPDNQVSEISSQNDDDHCKASCDNPPKFSNPINLCTPNIKKCSPQILDHDRAPKGMLEFRECSICLEGYRYTEVLCGLPCGHNFHMNCIMMWLLRDNHCCPICRWPSYKLKHHMHAHLQ